MENRRFAFSATLFIFLILQTVNADLEIKPIIGEEIYSGETYKNLFRIQNNGYSTSEKSCIDAFVYYNITGEDFFEKGHFTVKCINKYKSSGTGKFTPEKSGKYVLCGLITNSTSGYENQPSCIEIFVKGLPKTSFNISLKMNVLDEDKDSINAKQTIKGNQEPEYSKSKTPTGNAVYESSSLKSMNFSKYIFIGILVLLIALLLLKR